MGLTAPIILAVSVAAFIMVPIVILILGSFSSGDLGDPISPSLDNYYGAFSDPLFVPSFYNTIVFALGSTFLAIAIAITLAWIIVRTNTPWKRFAELLPIFPLLLPPFMDNIAWIFLTAPKAGIINRYLQDAFGIQPMLNAFSLPAMIWVYGLSQVPLSYLIIASAFTALDPAHEESATMSGGGIFRTFSKVTLPLMMPAVLSAGILTLVATLRAFETPTLMGIPGGVYVYVSRIFSAMQLSTPPDSGLATAYASILLAMTVFAVVFYMWSLRRAEKFQVITGRNYRPRILEIGRWKYIAFAFVMLYFFVAVFLPFMVVGLMSFMPFFSYTLLAGSFVESFTLRNYEIVLRHPFVQEGLLNSAGVGIASALLAVGIGFLTSYIVYRTKFKGRKMLEVIGTLPIAFPGLVLGLALLWTFFYLPVRIHPAIAILLALIIFKLPIALRAMSGSVVQIHQELEDASKIVGAGWAYTFRRVTIPIMKPALASAALFLFFSAFREVGALVLLAGPGFNIAAVTLFNYYGLGQWMEVSAGSLIYAAILFVVLITSRYVFKIRLRL
ncbi:MAG: iron ABC transporter permease [Thaumarchaeota archaeon]|nr:iron ABC transporter permease [Nitrososphaerota archaeon]